MSLRWRTCKCARARCVYMHRSTHARAPWRRGDGAVGGHGPLLATNINRAHPKAGFVIPYVAEWQDALSLEQSWAWAACMRAK